MAIKTNSIIQIDDLISPANFLNEDEEEISSIKDIDSSDEFDMEIYPNDNNIHEIEFINNQKKEFNKKYKLEFEKYTISTQTVISSIGTRVDLPLIYENLEHIPCGYADKSKCNNCSALAKEIKSIRFRSCVPKGNPPKKVTKRKNSKNKKVFYNQITIDIEIEAGRKISAKLFIDGKIQMAGCKNEEEAHKTVTILIKYLKKIADIEEPGMVTLPLKDGEHEKLMNMKEIMNKNKWRSYVYDKKSEHIKASILAKMEKFDIPIIRKAVEDKNKMKPQYFKIAMINSDFKVSIRDKHTDVINPVTIDREVLRHLLHSKYKIYCAPYEASRYPGVNAKKISSIDCIHGCKEGKGNPSMCAFNMKKKKITNGCVTVSILAFQQGKIILTGAQSTRQLDDTYKFITQVYEENFYEMRNTIKDKINTTINIDSDSDNI